MNESSNLAVLLTIAAAIIVLEVVMIVCMNEDISKLKSRVDAIEQKIYASDGDLKEKLEIKEEGELGTASFENPHTDTMFEIENNLNGYSENEHLEG